MGQGLDHGAGFLGGLIIVLAAMWLFVFRLGQGKGRVGQGGCDRMAKAGLDPKIVTFHLAQMSPRAAPEASTPPMMTRVSVPRLTAACPDLPEGLEVVTSTKSKAFEAKSKDQRSLKAYPLRSPPNR